MGVRVPSLPPYVPVKINGNRLASKTIVRRFDSFLARQIKKSMRLHHMTEKEKQEMLVKIQGVLERKGFTVVHALKIPKKIKK